MPTIPIYERQVRQQGLPNAQVQPQNPNVPAGAFGDAGVPFGKAGEAMAAVGADLNKLAEAQDVAAVMEAKNAADDYLTYLRTDKDKSYLNKKGRNALDVAPEYGTDFDTHLQKINDGLGNGRQRQLFEKVAGGLSSDWKQELGKYSLTEMNTYQKEVSESAIKKSAENAGLNWNNPERLGNEVEFSIIAAEHEGNRQGMPPDAIEGMKRKAATLTVNAAFMNAVNKDPMAGKAILDKYGDLIEQDDRAKYEKALKPIIATHQGNQNAAMIIASAASLSGASVPKSGKQPMPVPLSGAQFDQGMVVPPSGDKASADAELAASGIMQAGGDAGGIRIDAMPNDALTRAADAAGMVAVGQPRQTSATSKNQWMLEQARNSSKNPEEAAATVKAVEAHIKLEKEARDNEVNDLSEQIMQAKANGQPPPNDALVRLKALDIKKAKEAENYSNNTKPEIYNYLYSRTPQELLGVDLREYNTSLSGEDQKYFAKKQIDAKKPAGQSQMMTNDQLLSAAMKTIGLKKEDDPMRVNQLQRYFATMMAGEEAALGRKLNYKEAQAVADQAVFPNGKGKYFFEMQGSGAEKNQATAENLLGLSGRMDYSVVKNGVITPTNHDGMVNDIARILARKGLPPTNENIKATYEAMVKAGRFMATQKAGK